MKKIFITLLCIFLFLELFSQTMVTTIPQKRNVVLEEFTGIHCGYCPDGHKRAETLNNAYPGRVVLINIHQGNFAVPGTGEPDFRTIFGDSIAILADVTGYPAGSVNRHLFQGLSMKNGTAMGRANWFKAATEIFPQHSPVNVGFKTAYDSASRQLTVDVELYYTANSPQPQNFIQVALLENHVIGIQSDYSSSTHYDYDHKHILRYFLTGQWGDKVTTTTKGSFVTKTYQYTIPANWKAENCDVAVYVSEGKEEVYTGWVLPVSGATYNGETEVYAARLINPAKDIAKGDGSGQLTFDLSLTSFLSGTQDYIMTFTNDAPDDWEGTCYVESQAINNIDTISLNEQTLSNIQLKITPGTTPDFATYSLEMVPLNYPSSIPIVSQVYVISGVTDLLVNNDSPWGDGSEDTTASLFEDKYLAGLNFAGNTSFASIGSEIYRRASTFQLTDGVKHVYFNVGWSFPSFTDSLVVAFTKLLDNGGNLMVIGQDVSWDTWDDNGYNTANTQAFYTKYLHASYVADGSTVNNKLNSFPTDEVFATIGTTNLTNPYGNNSDGTPFFYPDELTAKATGKAIFYYNTTSKIGGVRSQSIFPYKTIILGFTLEMIADASVRNNIMKYAHDWFHGNISDIEFDESMNALGNPYPNPANQSCIIPVNVTGTGFFRLSDLSGKMVFSEMIASQSGNYIINTAGLPAGLYFYDLVSGKQSRKGKIQVIH